MSEVKRYTHDWRNQEMVYDEDGEFVYFEDYEHLKTKLELTNKELGLNIKSHLNDFCTLEKLKVQLDKAEAVLLLISAPHCDYRTFESETLERLIECITADTDCAREYFKEKGKV